MDTGKKIREIDVWIDVFTPCLKDNITGEVVNTEVIRIRRKSFLGKFNRKSGWYVNIATCSPLPVASRLRLASEAPSTAMPPTSKCCSTISRR